MATRSELVSQVLAKVQISFSKALGDGNVALSPEGLLMVAKAYNLVRGRKKIGGYAATDTGLALLGVDVVAFVAQEAATKAQEEAQSKAQKCERLAHERETKQSAIAESNAFLLR